MERQLELYCKSNVFVETAMEVAARIDEDGLAAFRRKLREAADVLQEASERVEVSLAAARYDDGSDPF
jgi:hypothetical protein